MQYVAIPNPETTIDHSSAVEPRPRPTSPTSPNRLTVPSNEKFSLTKGLGVWELTHGHDRVILKHEIGLAYVAYLMDHPNEPIHGLALALKVCALRNGQPADSAELIQERALALDDAEAARRLYRKQLELEAIVDDEDQTDPVKEEAYRELKEIYAFQKKNIARTSSAAQKASDAVGKAIKRLHQRLATAIGADGKPQILLRRFAKHLRKTILLPSGRGSGQGGVRPMRNCGGFFTFGESITENSL